MEASGSRRPKIYGSAEAKILPDPRGHKTYGSGRPKNLQIWNTGFHKS